MKLLAIRAVFRIADARVWDFTQNNAPYPEGNFQFLVACQDIRRLTLPFNGESPNLFQKNDTTGELKHLAIPRRHHCQCICPDCLGDTETWDVVFPGRTGQRTQ